MAEREIEGACITSILNTLKEDITEAPLVGLEETAEPIQSEAMIFPTTLVEEDAAKFFTDVVQWAGWMATPPSSVASRFHNCPIVIKQKLAEKQKTSPRLAETPHS
jgi:hypothetical protein